MGLGHSNDPNSVMYAFYSTDDIKLELQTDDIYAIQSLYDPARPIVPESTPRATLPTQTNPQTKAPTQKAPKLRELTTIKQF